MSLNQSNPYVTVQQLMNALTAFEVNLRTPGCLVYPSVVLQEDPQAAAALLFQHTPAQPYYQLTLDDRSQVEPELRQLWEDTEDLLMSCVFDANWQLSTSRLAHLYSCGCVVQLDFSEPQLALVYVALRDGLFYVDITSYRQRKEAA